jgi:ribosomal protein S18 acetylase RimI-like enzyme
MPELNLIQGGRVAPVGQTVVHYRKFRNTDPPGLVEIWNEVVGGKGGIHMPTSTSLERCVLAKPFFDPAGLIVAEDNGALAGFVHAGFGPDAAQGAVSTSVGVLCFLGVRSAQRGHGIGAGLLEQAESYLRQRGVESVYAGPHWPRGPFYQGLYGGSELPGFLASLADLHTFLTHKHYRVCQEVAVLRRRLRDPVKLIDPRLPRLRQQVEFNIGARKFLGSWWQECIMGPVEPLEFSLTDKTSGEHVATALGWYMEGFGGRAEAPAAGIVHLEVKEGRRRAGLGKLFLTEILRALQGQYFESAEVQVDQTNTVGLHLCHAFGFEQVDVGRIYQKDSL